MTGHVTGTKIKSHRIPRYYTKLPAVKCSPHMQDEGVGAQSARVVSTNGRHTLRQFASTLNVCRDTFVFGFVSTHPRTTHVFIMLGQNGGWMGEGGASLVRTYSICPMFLIAMSTWHSAGRTGDFKVVPFKRMFRIAKGRCFYKLIRKKCIVTTFRKCFPSSQNESLWHQYT